MLLHVGTSVATTTLTHIVAIEVTKCEILDPSYLNTTDID
jgi:hypothetical protein